MDWTTAPVVALMVFTLNPNTGEIEDGVWYANKPYATCMIQADSMRAKRLDPYKLPACIRVEAAKFYMEEKGKKK